MLRRLAFTLPLVVGSAFLAGCDSNDVDDDLTDAERIVGTWEATAVSVDVVVETPVGPVADSVPLQLDGEGEIVLTFAADGEHTFVARPPINAVVPVVGTVGVFQGEAPVTLRAQYSLDEDAGEIELTDDQPGSLTFGVPYTFSDDELRLVVESGDLIVALLADAGADPLLAEAVQGGSMTLTRR
jgi:hypothetical protein